MPYLLWDTAVLRTGYRFSGPSRPIGSCVCVCVCSDNQITFDLQILIFDKLVHLNGIWVKFESQFTGQTSHRRKILLKRLVRP